MPRTAALILSITGLWGAAAQSAVVPFPYRPLELQDFQAPGPIREAIEHARALGSVACVVIEPAPEMGFTVSSSSAGGDVRARIAEPSFRAVFDPSCAFWDRGSRLAMRDRLEHEQIHFAISEIAARAATLRMREATDALTVVAPSTEAAAAVLQRRVDEALEQASTEASERSALLDQELLWAGSRRSRIDVGSKSLQERRLEWIAEVESELAELARALERGD